VINSSLDEWIYMLKNEEVRDDFTSRNIDQAREKLSVMQMSEGARRNYERYLMELVSERDVMETAYQKGLMEGEQGKEQAEQRAKQAEQQAKQAEQQAEQAEQQAEQERQVKEKLVAKLRELGIDPDLEE
ncbi:hypothetical protein QUF64_11655, partial [Anaerolineales bacterium HSG6]|nr:hypothetical protein [Anaerolineales bacterium HSG6]